MKVAIHHQAHHAHSATRLAFGGGASFSQLMEGGASGASVSRERALGFAETGLLGLHYAHQLGGPSATHMASASIGMVEAQIEVDPVKQAFSAQQEASAFGPDPAATAKREQGFTFTGVAHARQEAMGDQPVWELTTNAIELVGPDGADAPSVVRAAARSIQAERKSLPFKLIVSGEANAATIIFEQDPANQAAVEDLEVLAHKIATEFGFTVRRFVTRATFAPHVSGT